MQRSHLDRVGLSPMIAAPFQFGQKFLKERWKGLYKWINGITLYSVDIISGKIYDFESLCWSNAKFRYSGTM